MQRRALLRQIAGGWIDRSACRETGRCRQRQVSRWPGTANEGRQAEVGEDLASGYRLAAIAAQASGVSMDFVFDGSAETPEGAAAAIEKFGKDKSIVATSGLVGTPHAIKAVPLAKASGLPVIGLRSGAAELRTGAPGVFHLRATFDAEIARMVTNLKDSATNRIGCVYSDDAFGKGAFTALQQAIKTQGGVELVAVSAAERTGKNIEEAVDKAFKPTRPTVLLLFSDCGPHVAAVEQRG